MTAATLHLRGDKVAFCDCSSHGAAVARNAVADNEEGGLDAKGGQRVQELIGAARCRHKEGRKVSVLWCGVLFW